MLIKLVLLSSLLAVTTAVAEICDIHRIPDLTKRGFRIENGYGKQILLIGEDHANIRAKASQLLTARVSPEDLKAEAEAFARDSHEAWTEAEQSYSFLLKVMESQHPPAFLGVSASAEGLAAREREVAVSQFYWWMNTRHLQALNIDWNRIFLLAAGPVFYLKMSRPDLFNKTKIIAVMPGAQSDPPEIFKEPAQFLLFVGTPSLTADTVDFQAACKSEQNARPVATAATAAAAAVIPARAKIRPVVEEDEPPKVSKRESRRALLRERRERRREARAERRPRVTYTRTTYSWTTRDGTGRRYKHVRRRR